METAKVETNLINVIFKPEEKNYTYKHNNFDQPNDQNQNPAPNMSTNPHQDHQRPLSTNTTNASEVDPNDNLKTGINTLDGTILLLKKEYKN